MEIVSIKITNAIEPSWPTILYPFFTVHSLQSVVENPPNKGWNPQHLRYWLWP